MNQQLIEQKAKAILQNSFDKNIKPLIPITFKEAEGENGYNWIYEAMQEYGEWMQGEGERLRECSNARKNEILRLREALDELAEELEKKTESASMWAKKAMEAGLERNQLSAEVERLKGERQWISVKDRLPEEGGRYWCYVRELTDLGYSHFQWNCAYNAKEKRFSDSTLTNGENVTHWMKLPEPPKPQTEHE